VRTNINRHLDFTVKYPRPSFRLQGKVIIKKNLSSLCLFFFPFPFNQLFQLLVIDFQSTLMCKIFWFLFRILNWANGYVINQTPQKSFRPISIIYHSRQSNESILQGQVMGDMIDMIDAIAQLKTPENATLNDFCYKLYDANNRKVCFLQRLVAKFMKKFHYQLRVIVSFFLSFFLSFQPSSILDNCTTGTKRYKCGKNHFENKSRILWSAGDLIYSSFLSVPSQIYIKLDRSKTLSRRLGYE